MNKTIVHIRRAMPQQYDLFFGELTFEDQTQALDFLHRNGYYKEPCKTSPSFYAVIVN